MASSGPAFRNVTRGRHTIRAWIASQKTTLDWSHKPRRRRSRACRASLSWEELDAYGKRTEEVVTPTGRQLRVKSIAFCDMEEWASGMYVIVRVRPGRGWRRFLGESAVETRGDDNDPVPARPTAD